MAPASVRRPSWITKPRSQLLPYCAYRMRPHAWKPQPATGTVAVNQRSSQHMLLAQHIHTNSSNRGCRAALLCQPLDQPRPSMSRDERIPSAEGASDNDAATVLNLKPQTWPLIHPATTTTSTTHDTTHGSVPRKAPSGCQHLCPPVGPSIVKVCLYKHLTTPSTCHSEQRPRQANCAVLQLWQHHKQAHAWSTSVFHASRNDCQRYKSLTCLQGHSNTAVQDRGSVLHTALWLSCQPNVISTTNPSHTCRDSTLQWPGSAESCSTSHQHVINPQPHFARHTRAKRCKRATHTELPVLSILCHPAQHVPHRQTDKQAVRPSSV